MFPTLTTVPRPEPATGRVRCRHSCGFAGMSLFHVEQRAHREACAPRALSSCLFRKAQARPASSIADEPHHHVDMGNLEIVRRLRQAIDANGTARDIDEPPLRLHEEMVVVGDVGVEIDRKSTRLNSSHLGISYA